MKRVPLRVQEKLYLWARSVHEVGLDEVRKIRGYRDHALKGSRKGQRSISLDPLWRAIYTVENDAASVQFVSVNEVTPHKY